jgi:hypothetical protein
MKRLRAVLVLATVAFVMVLAPIAWGAEVEG